MGATIAGEWLNSLIFHNIKCITANGQMIIYVGVDYVSCDNHLSCAKTLWEALSFLIYAYGFMQHHMIGVMIHSYGFHVIT